MKLTAFALLGLLAACGSPQKTDIGSATETEADSGPDPVEAEVVEAEQVAAIEWTVNQTAAAVFACYKRATAERFRLEGRVTLGIELTDGVPVVAVIADELYSPVLSECLVEVLTQFAWPKVFEPGQSIALPFSFVAADDQYTVERAHVAVTEATTGVKVTSILDENSTGNPAAMLSVLEMDPGTRVPLHEHSSAQLLYVVEGGGIVYEVAGVSKAVEVTRGTAIYVAAGVAHAFEAGPAGVEAVQLRAPGETVTTPVSDKQATKRARERRRAVPLTAKLSDAKAHEIAGGKATVAILFDKRSAVDDAAYVGLITAQPGLNIPEHVHGNSTELLYLLSGEGLMTVKDQSYPVTPDTAVQIPPNTVHSFEVISKDPVIAVQFYTPSGPEQRFVK